MTFTVGQRVKRIPCTVKCDSADCDGIHPGAVGTVNVIVDKNRTSVNWDHRGAGPWWVWNHGLAPMYQGKLYIELVGGDSRGGA
jgi:hypothetical protein